MRVITQTAVVTDMEVTVCVCVSVHACRAPVLVALALIESGMKYEDAIQLIRQ